MTGDGFDFREKAQDPDTHFGKTIRMTVDGDPAEGFLFQTHPWSSAMDTETRKVWLFQSRAIFQHEHGPQGGDEINIIEAAQTMDGL